MKHETIIKVEGLDKYYPSGDSGKVQILKNVSFEIDATDFVIIYGPSGSGKSTVLNHLVGLEVPDKGKIVIRGNDLTRMDDEQRAVFRAQKFGMVYQVWYWTKSLSVVENVALPLYIQGDSRSSANKKALSVLEELGLDKYANKNPLQLSGGEQQRVALARALVNNPWIIVADEPTGNLDTHNSDLVMQTFQKLNVRNKRTIIMVTHNLVYLPMATKTIAIKDGEVVSGGTSELKKQIRAELKGVI